MTIDPGNFKITTAFNQIDAVFNYDILTLQGEDDSMHSEIDMSCPHNLMMVNLQWMMAALLFYPRPERVLMLGTAGGSLLHFFRHYFPECHVTAVDCDAEMLEILKQRGILPPPSTKLDYVIDDAFSFLQTSTQTYDLLLIDLFVTAQSPRELIDREVTTRLAKQLKTPGIAVANLILEGDDDLQRVREYWNHNFADQVLQTEVEGLENQLLFGFKGDFEYQSIGYRLQQAQQLTELHGFDYNRALQALFASNPVGQGIL